MHFNPLASVYLLWLITPCFVPAILASPVWECKASDSAELMKQLQDQYSKTTLASLTRGNCTRENIAVRRSWDSLSAFERKEYIAAVKCLQSKPSRSDPKVVPGARNRRDDFTYAHINQTDFIHVSGYLLPWHRVFVWSYEEALRNECGYSGYQPYWEWSKHSHDQSQSPLFDGSETSISGNGLVVPQTSINYSVPGLPVPFYIVRNPGTGGGCLHDGPFANFTVNLGPVAPNLHPNPENPYGLLYNPRCLTRDFSPKLSQAALTYKNVTDLLQSPDIHTFRPLLERSMHPLAHATLGGELSDLFTSPGDPAFVFLHSQVDRLWSIWQSMDYKTRTNGLDGTRTFHNDPPSGNVTLQDYLEMGLAGGRPQVSTVMSATAGPFCYMYA